MAGYVGNVPVPQSVREDQSFTATAGQTTFNTLGYTDGNRIKVSLNGVLLEGGGVDYTATNGSDVVLTVAASADDIIRFETFNEFTLVNSTMTTPTLTGTTLKSDVTLKNDTEQDTDGGRASKIIYQGEQSGGEISTLAEIEASHDGTSDDEKANLIFRTNDGSDGSSPTEAARIDSSQTFMVGKTATNYQTVGVEAKTNGSLFATAASNAPLVVTRNTSDGNVASFYKDSTNAGNIAVTSNIISILGKDGDGGIAIQNNSYGDIVYPTSNSTGGASDNAIDLGYNNGRWKDLYLGGGAYIGGTVAANKLDDYEEGTFTAGLAGYYGMPNTAVTSTGQYTKIGNQVSFWISFENKDTTGASGNMWVTGLPFASSGNYEICCANKHRWNFWKHFTIWFGFRNNSLLLLSC